MAYLCGVTLLWAFSFSLIGVYLAGQVDSYFAVLVRISLATLVFLPLLDWRALSPRAVLGMMAVGAVQIGLMYQFFYQSFVWLSVPEVLLFTILTPVYLTLFEDLLVGRLHLRCLLAAAGAVAGAAIIRYTDLSADFWAGFFIVQGANICFAVGQVAWRRVALQLPPDVPAHRLFAWFFIGAWPLAALGFGLFGDHSALAHTPVQWGVLLWLGIAASGLGYYAWNRGALAVDAGTLAVMNNVLIPAGLLVNLAIWNPTIDGTALLRLAAGGLVMALSLWISTPAGRVAAAPPAF